MIEVRLKETATAKERFSPGAQRCRVNGRMETFTSGDPEVIAKTLRERRAKKTPAQRAKQRMRAEIDKRG